MTFLRRAWLWITGALAFAGAALLGLWRRAVRQRDEARAQRDAAVRSAERERGLATDVARIEAEHRTAGDIIAAKRVEAEKAIEARREETARAVSVEDLARLETARRARKALERERRPRRSTKRRR